MVSRSAVGFLGLCCVVLAVHSLQSFCLSKHSSALFGPSCACVGGRKSVGYCLTYGVLNCGGHLPCIGVKRCLGKWPSITGIIPTLLLYTHIYIASLFYSYSINLVLHSSSPTIRDTFEAEVGSAPASLYTVSRLVSSSFCAASSPDAALRGLVLCVSAGDLSRGLGFYLLRF
jgi:hypothetical protein